MVWKALLKRTSIGKIMHWSIYICLLVLSVDRSFAGTVDDFEFGLNTGRVVFSKTGFIDIWAQNKITKVPIIIPACTNMTYVHVAVDNALGPPTVSLNMNIQVVTIKYRKHQHSKSTYVVIAKGVPDKENC